MVKVQEDQELEGDALNVRIKHEQEVNQCTSGIQYTEENNNFVSSILVLKDLNEETITLMHGQVQKQAK